MKLTYTNEISVADYNMLRENVKWGALDEEQAAAGLQNSAFIITCKDGDKTVGSARVIWDGGYVVYIADVMVLDTYQLNGIGREMITRLIDTLRKQLKPGWRMMVVLCAAKGKEAFYKKFDFIERPTDILGAGMFQWLDYEEEN